MARRCNECGADYTSDKPHALFCSDACRKTFNNRRMKRGAELYDCFMALRYERGWSKAVGMWQLVCRLCADWREQDKAAGRSSYITPYRWVRDNKTRLTAIRLG